MGRAGPGGFLSCSVLSPPPPCGAAPSPPRLRLAGGALQGPAGVGGAVGGALGYPQGCRAGREVGERTPGRRPAPGRGCAGPQARRRWSAHTSHLSPRGEGTRATGPAAAFPSSRALMRKSALPCLKPKVSSPRVTEQDPPRVAGPQGLRTGPAPGGGALTPRLWDEAAGGPVARVQGRAQHCGWECRGPPPPLAWPAVGDTAWGPAR